MSDPQFESYTSLLALAKANPTKNALRAAMEKASFTVNLDDPISGYFRLRRDKDGPFDPVAIWREGDDLFIRWGHDDARLEAVWPHCVWNPISYEWYCDKLDGKEWPDVHAPAAEPLDGIEELVGRVEAGPGHNSGASADEVAALADEIGTARAGVRQYATIADDMHLAQSQDLRSRLLKLHGEAKKMRDALSRPHLSALEEIRGKWSPLVDSAQDGANAIKRAQEAFATAKLRKQREEEERIAAERREAERLAQEQADAARAAVDRGEPPPDQMPMQMPPEPARVAPQTSFKGGAGRAASVKTVHVITEVTDWPALFAYFVEDQDARDYLLKRAETVLKRTGEIPPGCKIDVAAKVA